MFKKILVPLDGSENAERAIPWVKRYAGPSKALVVLTAILPRPTHASDGPELIRRQEAVDALARMERELNYAGVPVKTVLREGPPALSIVQLARREGCELIVMTTRGNSRLGRWRVGGVTAQTMRMSHVPVLIVRSATPLPRQGHVKRIVVPLDGSGSAELVLPWAERLARVHKSSLILLHIAPPKPNAAEARLEALRRHTGRLVQALRKRDIPASLRVERGDPAETILRTAGADGLIAMTTHGYGGFKRWIFGSVAEKVCTHADVPVFVHRGGKAPSKHRTLEGTLA